MMTVSLSLRLTERLRKLYLSWSDVDALLGSHGIILDFSPISQQLEHEICPIRFWSHLPVQEVA